MAEKKNAKNSKKKENKASDRAKKKQTKQSAASACEIGGFVCILVGVFTFLTMFTKDALLTGLYYKLICGLIGTAGFYVLPVMLVMMGVILLCRRNRPVVWRMICGALTVISISAVSHLFMTDNATLQQSTIKTLWNDGIAGKSGGVIGGWIARTLYGWVAYIAYIILILTILIALLTTINFSLASIFKAVRNRPRQPKEEEETPYVPPAERLVNRMAERQIARGEQRKRKNAAEFDLPVDDPPLAESNQPEQTEKAKRRGKGVDVEKTPAELMQEELKRADAPTEPEKKSKAKQASEPKATAEQHEPPLPPLDLPPLENLPEKVKPEEAKRSAAEVAWEITQNADEPSQEYHFPPTELLHEGGANTVDGTQEMRENSKRLSETLKCFGIEPHIVNVTRGPSVTRYEIELERGVKLSKVTNLADDIALSLGADSVRISAIPDKISVVGIEVPNKLVSTVYAREVIDSAAFRTSKSPISFAVGKDISGRCIIGDIATLPHMLIAGTTGSGKSVCMNTLIISLLYKSRPDEVRLIMVDPKMVELGIYNGIPHLLIPVVTDPKKAAGALQWTVTEMLRRYRLMSEIGVRDMDSYNKVVASDPDQKKLERIVVVIDELADLMLVAAKEVEESICRIAQMGRAAGMHLVIATQRPSADVITGLMKANIPSRIAFAVASAMESRIILDTAGAEKLVGKGDMLFAPLGKGKPKRVQGCFITEDEVQDVVSFIKNKTQPDYSEDIMEQIEKKAEQSGKGKEAAAPAQDSGNDGDELLPAAVEVILETGQASVSMLQRRLKLGYARAARIMDEMEEHGIVGPFEGSKPRQLLITKEQWLQMQNGEGAAAAVEEENP